MRYINLLVLSMLLIGCKEDPPVCPAPQPTMSNGALVLCEGLFQQNNASVSWIDFSSGTIDNSYFVTTTNRQVGDTGNDIKRYGGKIYVVVDVSSVVEVMSASNFAPIAQIEMINNGVSKHPRSIAFHGSNAYVTCYDGYVDVIDTATLSVTNRIAVGSNPEGLAVANGKLYVANSGGLNFPNVDSTLSVIDLTTHTELSRITVGNNPGGVIADAGGEIYAIARGDYGANPSRLVRVNTTTDALEETFAFDAVGIAPINSMFLVYDNASISLFDPAIEQLINTDYVNLAEVNTLYNVSYNPATNLIYVSDAMNYTNTGYLRVYNTNGVYQNSYHVGLNPSKVLFYD